MQPQEHVSYYLNIRGVEAVYVFSDDGLLIASAAKETWTADHDSFVAALTQAAIFAQELGGLVEEHAHTMTIEYKHHTVVVQELAEIGYVALVAGSNANIGLLRVYCARLRQGLLDSFEPA